MVRQHSTPVKPSSSLRSHPIYPTSAVSLSRPALRQKKAFILETLSTILLCSCHLLQSSALLPKG
ncbi:hypothetical protein D0861_04682 [Hortaea werneckii]|uniref:Uncharacterized protein n=1 Tax=Hortaea werneckii TaxID=91943 RepID=A0A3M7FJ42_HORWE|nr:hypothetical protein D0861_04682 [Hortaea werneckii]